MHACGKPAFSLLQLDANLIEEEPYNRLTQKNKKRLNEAQQNEWIMFSAIIKKGGSVL